MLCAMLIYCGKLWFFDRMVRLYQDMSAHNEHYRAWLG